MPPTEKPKITEKEVSWHEAVAAAKARKEHRENAAKASAELERVALLPTQKTLQLPAFGKLDFEHYSIATSMLLAELASPLTMGTTIGEADLVLAALVFSHRELVGDLVALYGGSQARSLLLEGALFVSMARAFTEEGTQQFMNLLENEYRLIRRGNGQDPEAAGEASPEPEGKA